MTLKFLDSETHKLTAHFVFEKMELHDGESQKKCRVLTQNLQFDPTLALHWIGRGGSDGGDLLGLGVLIAVRRSTDDEVPLQVTHSLVR